MMFSQRFIGALCFVAMGLSAAIASDPSQGAFDHSDYDAILKRFVNERGLVDYRGLSSGRDKLDAYVNRLGETSLDELKRWPIDEQKAFFINAYNAITLVRILDHYPPKGLGIIHPKVSIRNIDGVWDKLTTKVAGQEITLDYIEHQILRPVYKDARIHVAIVCASIGCPNLAAEAYTGNRLEEQLEREARRFARDASKNKIDRESKRVAISSIFDWFKEDFEGYKSEVPAAAESGGKARELAGGLGFLAKYAAEDDRAFLQSGDYKVSVGKYDWSLNEQ